MPSVTFVRPDGDVTTVAVPEGMSVMRAALLNGVDGIIGECGGQAMCATCHVYTSDSGLPPIGDDEEEMLECAAAERTDESRLGCQLKAGRDFDSLTVRLPSTQV